MPEVVTNFWAVLGYNVESFENVTFGGDFFLNFRFDTTYQFFFENFDEKRWFYRI